MNIILGIHNLLRWVIVISATIVLFRMARGLIKKTTWGSLDGRFGLVLTIALDLQLLLGLILYFLLSPAVKAFFANISEAMKETTLRYWGVEHILMMLLAVVFGHMGSALSKKQVLDQKKFQFGVIFHGLAVLFLLGGIPWFRPLLPVF